MYCIFRYIRVSKFLAQVHMRPKAHPVRLKAQRFVVISCTQINVESLQIRKMYEATFICMTKNDGDFKSK